MSNLREIRTMEEVAYLLDILFTNMNNLNKAYYDIFINPEPMDVPLERYNEKGQITTIMIPNRAKDKQGIYKGQGDPNGSQLASQGAFYLDTNSTLLYYKSTATNDAYGWQSFWSSGNLEQDGGGSKGKFLAPDGNGDSLKNLSATNISVGILNVEHGGTGGAEGQESRSFNEGKLLKGNGTEPIQEAEEGVDYLTPDFANEDVGMIAYFPKNPNDGEAYQKRGWLVCDGTSYPSASYPKLSKYLTGLDDLSGNFNVPDLRAAFIRCYGTRGPEDGYVSSGDLGEIQPQNVGTHFHQANASLTVGAHEHAVPMTSFIVGTDETTGQTLQSAGSGQDVKKLIAGEVDSTISTEPTSVDVNVDLTTEEMVGSPENIPMNIALIPMIKCDYFYVAPTE